MGRLIRKLLLFFPVLLCSFLVYYIPLKRWHTRPRASEYEESWLDVQKERKLVLRYICEKYKLHRNSSLPDPSVAKMMYVEHKHKLIYCEVPKVGCSSWKRIILLLKMNMTSNYFELSNEVVHSRQSFEILSSFPRDRQRQLLSSYTKVMFTRHPFERLVSAYRDKFLRNRQNKYYIKTMAELIKSKVSKSKNSTGPVTFLEFVHFILDENPKYSDTHWKPMSSLCDPCNIHYDIIGKFKKLKEDSDQVLRSIGASKDFRYPFIIEPSTQTSSNIKKTYFSNLSTQDVLSLMKKYYMDFMLFDYPVF
ncbi:carbohydrate sulfotransferase 8-like [Lissotriton helveticus]